MSPLFLCSVTLQKIRNSFVALAKDEFQNELDKISKTINKPKIILADEPTGNLDHISAKNVFKILLNLKKSNRLIIFATHNREFAKLSDCKIEMIDGNIKSIDGKIQSV